MQTYPEDHALHQLVAEADLFLGIDTATFKAHSAKKLYQKRESRPCTAAHKCLNLTPELRNLAKGGLLSTDEYDTLDDNGEAVLKSPAAKSTPSKGK
ncbi:hypothetical protein GN958_ATG18944, partial [Phytophthora infestans]